MENIIQLHDRKFRIMIPAAKIDEAVEAVAQRINADYAGKETPLFLGILNGSFMFMSDLIKKIEFQGELSFVKLASYDEQLDGLRQESDRPEQLGSKPPRHHRRGHRRYGRVDRTHDSRSGPANPRRSRSARSSNPDRTARRCPSSTALWRSATSSSWATGWITTSWAAVPKKTFTS